MATFGYSLKKTWLMLFTVTCVCLVITFYWLYLSKSSLLGHHSTLLLRVRVNGSDGDLISEVYVNNSLHTKTLSLPSILPTYTTSNNITKTKYHRYVIQWFNWEQLTMAASNMISLSWFATFWKAHLVEPFTCNSRYFGLPHPRRKTYSLFTLFNQDKFNNLLDQHNILPIVHFNDFIQHANRSIIVVHILYDGFDLSRFGSQKQVSRNELISLLHTNGSNHYIDCSHTVYMKRIGSTLLQWINSKLSRPFKISHYCCVNGSHPTYTKEMASKCKIPNNGNVSVVFTDWKGISPIKNFRVFVPEAENVDMPHPSRDVYPYSLEILNNASLFLLSLVNSQEFIGVHLRTEKLGPRNGKKKGFFNSCLKTSHFLKERILSNYTNLPVLYFSDLGPFGTKSCMRNCLGKKFIYSSLNKYGIRLSQYNPKHFGGIVDSGFVAAVEQETLSRAKILILVGGGSFQSQVVTRYKYYGRHRKHFIHRICTE